jgi:hypothetical protein
MVQWIRDFTSIGRRERTAVNFASLGIGVAMLLVMDRLQGLSFGRSLFNLGVVILVGVAISLTHNTLAKRAYLRNRQVVLP